jgi:sterol desaturase/sphingolipid hydroxylase (fatty acid hydroxylase superfamily)
MTAAKEARVVRPTTCQMFETPLIERFSRTHPIQPTVFWLTALGLVSWRSLADGLALLPFVGLVLAGLLAWSLTEYVLHRWAFHFVGPKPWQRRLHFILHGVHHDFPQDPGRLVMPLGVSIPLGAVFFLLMRLLLGAEWSAPVFVGFGLGYLAYDNIHYALHHFKLSSGVGRWLKRHHMLHHHAGAETRWGVSSPLWDVVFGTMGQPPASPED